MQLSRQRSHRYKVYAGKGGEERMKYTQREWDRVVGYGKVQNNVVVESYSRSTTRKTDGTGREKQENRERSKGC